jgi:hypothetical protein
MKLVMTLIARDEADIVDAQLAFHLNAGVDYVVASDHLSEDGTTDVLRRYERDGHLRYLRREGDYREVEWRTEMARLAATDLGADWVFASDADEFWWPRGPDLKDVLEAIPKRYGIVKGFWRGFVPTGDEEMLFSERMTVRVAATAPINDPLSIWRPNAKVVHRARADVKVGRGNHSVEGDLVPLRGWYPIEVLHFPIRTRAQFEHKATYYGSGEGVRFHEAHRVAHERVSAGREGEAFETLWLDDDELERGLASGSLVRDERLRDALRSFARGAPVPAQGAEFALPGDGPRPLRFPQPTVVDDVAYAVDAAVLGEADLVRAQRRLDELEARLATLERRPARRLGRLVRRLGAAARRRPR